MEAIFEGLIALMSLLLELIVSLYLALLEVVVQILMVPVGWITSPFWSKEHRQAGMPDPWKIAIRRAATVILILGFAGALGWCWSAFGKPVVKPPPAPSAKTTELGETAKGVWNVLEKKLKERKAAQP